MVQAKVIIAWIATAALLLFAGAVVIQPARAQQPDSGADALAALGEEIAIAGILERLHTAPAPDVIVLRNVRVVDPVERTVRDGQSIVVSLGVIYRVVSAADEPRIEGALVIDGGGRFAAPGLADMHIHTESASSYLLNIANGVTATREMGGLPWMLAARDAANNDRLLAPTSYVAGSILNFAPLEGYAVVVTDTFNARRVVRQQAACGYDFIKVHNLMPQRIFDVIAEEARHQRLDLVGHVPHNISVRHAAEQAMRTMEHLKGWLNDRTLQMGDLDYAAAALPELWVTPTQYAYRNFAGSGAMEAMRTGPASRYVPARTRASWESFAKTTFEPGFALNLSAQPLRREIMNQLIARHAHFLAGTDAANYPFQTMGFALIEELRLLREAGVPEDAVWRAATSEAAAAMHAERDFGRVAPGMRADIVLTDRNPLEGAADAYGQNQGVMMRGRWLDRQRLDQALADLAALYADDKPTRRVPSTATLLAAGAEGVAARGFVFNTRIIREAAAALRKAGQAKAADRIAHLAIEPVSGPCAAIVR